MKIPLIETPAQTLIGLEARFIGRNSPDANNHRVIPALFQQFLARKPELPAALDRYTYGATMCLPPARRSREDELVYLAGINVAENASIPTDMTIWRIPVRTYALFRHRGPVAQIDATFDHIYGIWLPQSGYEPAADASLERYDERFGDGGEKSELDILIPVQVRR